MVRFQADAQRRIYSLEQGGLDDAEAWIARFRAGRIFATSPMHWGPFSRMSDEDLTALWLFFNTLDPIANEVGAMVFDASDQDG